MHRCKATRTTTKKKEHRQLAHLGVKKEKSGNLLGVLINVKSVHNLLFLSPFFWLHLKNRKKEV